MFDVIYQRLETVFHRDSVDSSNTKTRVENMTCSGVFLTKFEVFG